MKINLTVKENNKIEKIQHEIEEVNLFQVTQALMIAKDVLKMLEEDQRLQEFLNEIMNADDEEGDQRILQTLGGAFEVLLANVPEKAIDLLSALSNVDQEVLLQQKLDDVFDIYDAVIQVNDIEKLINRGKKSLSLTRKQVNFQKLFPNLKKNQTGQSLPS